MSEKEIKPDGFIAVDKIDGRYFDLTFTCCSRADCWDLCEEFGYSEDAVDIKPVWFSTKPLPENWND